MPAQQVIKIESREHLLATLAEAAELEHSLMCMYLFAVFSLKEETSEGLTESELTVVQTWRKSIVEICVQEMTHLALVNNLITSIGGTAHFSRPDFPIRQGLFPAEFSLELAPFSLGTLEHFIFLERAEDEVIPDSAEYSDKPDVVRGTETRRLMAHVGDYQTVGALYEAVRLGIETLSMQLGEKGLFRGSHSLQMSPRFVKLDGLTVIDSKNSALDAVHLIVDQGEGAKNPSGSHFGSFTKMRDEFESLTEKNPSFNPARFVVQNPVMRQSETENGTVWINHSESALVLDLANALYSLMIRFLVQFYAMEHRSPEAKKILSDSAFSLMGALSKSASLLTQLPATTTDDRSRAGISFTLDRYTNPYELECERFLLDERMTQIIAVCDRLQKRFSDRPSLGDRLNVISKVLTSIRTKLGRN